MRVHKALQNLEHAVDSDDEDLFGDEDAPIVVRDESSSEEDN